MAGSVVYCNVLMNLDVLIDFLQTQMQKPFFKQLNQQLNDSI